VVDQQGNAATYAYDAVGNILRIERFDTAGIPGPVGITLVSPNKGKVGASVQIFGKGFSATAGQNGVAFNGTPATVTEGAPNRLVTSVPAGATTGPITVTTPLGSAISPTPFTVVGSIAIDPTTVTLVVTGTQQFTATGADAGTAPPVRWSVNGITGGDPTVGTISPEGLYTAPGPENVTSIGLTLTVTATHTDDPTVSASAAVTIRPTQPGFLAARAVSAVFASATVAEKAITTAVSVARAVVDRNVAAAVSVVKAPSIGVVAAVSIVRGLAFTAAAPVAVTRQPVITAVAPSGGARGAMELAITLTGSGFTGATAVTFRVNNSPDANVTVLDLVIDPDGTQAAVTVAIAPGAALGPRVVQIATPAGTSTPAGTGGNVFEVTTE
jgi:hypothetical protein